MQQGGPAVSGKVRGELGALLFPLSFGFESWGGVAMISRLDEARQRSVRGAGAMLVRCHGLSTCLLTICSSSLLLALISFFPSPPFLLLPFTSPSSYVSTQVDYFNKRRVLQLRQDLMERKASEQMAQMGGVGAKKSA